MESCVARFGGEVDEVFSVLVLVLIDFERAVRKPSFSTRRYVRFICERLVFCVPRLFLPVVTERRIYAFVELLGICPSCPPTTFEILHQPQQPIRACGAICRDPGQLVPVCFSQSCSVSPRSRIFYSGELRVDVSPTFFVRLVFSGIWIWQELQLLRVLGCSLGSNLRSLREHWGLRQWGAMAVPSPKLAIEGREPRLIGRGVLWTGECW